MATIQNKVDELCQWQVDNEDSNNNKKVIDSSKKLN